MKIFNCIVICVCCLILLTEAKATEDKSGVIWNFFFGGKEFSSGITLASSNVVYNHWGRKDCPKSSKVVYIGYLGGGHYTNSGAGTNPLCLPSSPDYNDQLFSTGSARAKVFGAEYQTAPSGGEIYAPWGHLYQNDPSCAVCLATGRSTSMMIPAKRTCPGGWTKEYEGLLMGGKTDHKAAHEFLCVDGSPQSRDNSATNHNGFLLYPAVGVCGTLKCPPYVNNRELPCVVCTR
ncbi:short-chain collagen C4-like isoform X2 [Antedon mediterranea]|uniref:short-chain collagen C4-like isoform X2 n=1 Tax=Antedon mediterranea TaxID=105859 RepID=UPI003AF93AED